MITFTSPEQITISRAKAFCRREGKFMTNLAMLALAVASLPAPAHAQSARSQTPPYCFDLSRVVDLAVTKERFASIAGRPRRATFAIRA
jgi:hypothetical protein